MSELKIPPALPHGAANGVAAARMAAFAQAGDLHDQIVLALKRAGIDLACSLPDKWLSGLLGALDRDGSFTHVRVTREEEALAICGGAYLGGRLGVTICQTAGVLLSVNTLAAHVHQHHFPQLILCAHRGTAEDSFFFQVYKGQVIKGVLDAIGVECVEVLEEKDVPRVEQAARHTILKRAPVVVLLGKRVLVGADSFG